MKRLLLGLLVGLLFSFFMFLSSTDRHEKICKIMCNEKGLVLKEVRMGFVAKCLCITSNQSKRK